MQIQRVQTGVLVTSYPVSIDESQHRRLFCRSTCCEAGARCTGLSLLFPSKANQVLLDLLMGYFRVPIAVDIRQLVEYVTPVVIDGARINQIGFIQAFDECGITSRKSR